jgi:hypothetical protein
MADIVCIRQRRRPDGVLLLVEGAAGQRRRPDGVLLLVEGAAGQPRRPDDTCACAERSRQAGPSLAPVVALTVAGHHVLAACRPTMPQARKVTKKKLVPIQTRIPIRPVKACAQGARLPYLHGRRGRTP